MKKLYLATFLLAVVQTSFAQSGPLQITTASGMVEGVREKSGIRAFKGIPFAAPPVGKLRWKAPQPVKGWTGVRKTVRFAAKPMQANIFGDMNSRAGEASEDCLYLNVWAPPAKGPFPVLVYFYGGGFVAGDASEPRYDGESMAARGIVAVTVNYRLGVFGFLAHPELSAEAPYKASGNYGLLDQAAALQWVKKNINVFGGDPAKITIAGESAGSISVSAQMASPLSKNLLAGAIGESGSILGALSAVPMQQGEQTGLQFAQSIGAASLAALRNMSGDSLLNAAMKFGAFRFASTIDGYFFPESPYNIYATGKQAKIPLLAGWNNEEMSYAMILGQEKPTKEAYEKAMQRIYGTQSVEALRHYPAASNDMAELAATDLASDRFIAFSTWKWIDLHSKTGGKPVYRYYYEKARPAMTPEMGNATPGLAGGVQKGAAVKAPAPAAHGAVHSAEIEYAMGNLASNKVYAWTDEDYTVSHTMQTYFANFIKTGNPSAYTSNLPIWTAIDTAKAVPVMHINVLSRLVPETEAMKLRYQWMDKTAGK